MSDYGPFRTVSRYGGKPGEIETTKYRYAETGVFYITEESGVVIADPFQYEKWLEWLVRTRA